MHPVFEKDVERGVEKGSVYSSKKSTSQYLGVGATLAVARRPHVKFHNKTARLPPWASRSPVAGRRKAAPVHIEKGVS